MKTEELRLLVQICKLYYFENLSQKEIADKLYISRPQVSKLLTRAKEQNIISININDPFAEEFQLAGQLKKRYHLKEVLVADTRDVSKANALKVLAKSMSVLFTSFLANGNKVGISAGFTVAACARYMNIYNCRNLQFIPLLAGLSFEGEYWYANSNCQRLAERFGSKYMVLNAPLVVRNSDLRGELEDNELIAPVVSTYDKLDAILLGIGQTTIDSTLGKCPVSKEEITWPHEHGAKAIVGASFIDAGGNEFLQEQSDLFLGIKLPQIKKCKSVVAVAIGEEKAEAIKAALKGGYITAFCTDLATAKLLI